MNLKTKIIRKLFAAFTKCEYAGECRIYNEKSIYCNDLAGNGCGRYRMMKQRKP